MIYRIYYFTCTISLFLCFVDTFDKILKVFLIIQTNKSSLYYTPVALVCLHSTALWANQSTVFQRYHIQEQILRISVWVCEAWQVSRSAPVEFIIEKREDVHSGTGTWEELRRLPPEIHHLEISLLPFCTYHFKVAAVNEIGASEFSLPSESYITPPAGNSIITWSWCIWWTYCNAYILLLLFYCGTG